MHNFINFNSNKYVASLTQLLGEEKPIELVRLINVLTPLDTLTSLSDLVDRIKKHASDPVLTEVIQHQVNNLIFKQFPKPIGDSIREVISNALDANARVHSTENIDIKIDKDTLSITDSGDGLSFATLINFFVQSRSINSSAIFSLDNSLPNVTGRFGQGVLSIFYMLLYHTRVSSNPIPKFVKDEKQISLCIPYSHAEKPQMIEFFYHPENQEFKYSTSSAIRKIVIDTCRNGEALKIKFIEIEGKVYVDILTKKKPTLSKGTRFTIVSPLIKTHFSKITQSIERTFTNVVSPKIFLNARQINAPKEDLKEIPFDGGSLHFFPSTCNKQGSLIICEDGKQICKYSLKKKDSLVSTTVILNFNKLNLTHERASVDFKNSECLKHIQQLLQYILDAKDLSAHEKSILLNTVSIILQKDRFDLQDFLKAILKNSPYRILPNNPGFETVGDAHTLLLHSQYLDACKEPFFYQSGSLFYYWIDNLSTSIVICKNGLKKHFFLDRRLHFADDQEKTMFNLSIVNAWLHETQSYVQIPLEQIFGSTLQTETPHEKIEISHEKFTLINLAKCGISLTFENSNSSSEITEEREQFIQELRQSMASLYAEDISSSVLAMITKLLNMYRSFTPLGKRNVKYICHVLCEHQDLNFFVNDKALIPISSLLKLKKIKHLEDIFIKTKAFLKKHPKEEKLVQQYVLFGVHGATIWGTAPDQMGFFDTAYWRWKKLLEASEYPNFLEDIVDNQRYNQFQSYQRFHLITDEHVLLMNNVLWRNSKKEFLLQITHMQDIPYLLEQPQQVREMLIMFCIKLRALLKRVMSFNKNTYELLNKAMQHFCYIENFYQHIACVEAFFGFNGLEEIFSPIPVNWQCLLQYFHDTLKNAPQNHSINFEEIKTIIGNFLRLYDQITACLNVLKNHKLVDFTNVQELAKASERLHSLDLLANYRDVLALALEWGLATQKSHDFVLMRNSFLKIMESKVFISPTMQGFINAALNCGKTEFSSQNFIFPQIDDTPIPLQQDPDVLAVLKNETLAASRIQNALKQTNQAGSWAGEIIKNPIEAEAENITIQLHLNADQFYVVVQDDGKGMGAAELQALKTPLCTTKRKEESNPNFGWGFFTLFHEFEAVFVTTSQDGRTYTDLLFENKNGILLRQQATRQEEGSKGTKLILKKSSKNPISDFIQIKTHFQNFCKHIHAVKIDFQGAPCSQYPLKAGTIQHTEILVENGISKGPITFQISDTEGLFFKNMRLGTVPGSGQDLLPENVKEALTNQSENFSIFLPSLEQNMNRNLLLSNKNLKYLFQRGILESAIKFYLNTCLKQGKLKDFSIDLWSDFKINYNVVSKDVQKILNALTTKDWTQALNQQNLSSEDTLITYAKNVFDGFTQNSSSVHNQNYALEIPLSVIKKESINQKLNKFTKELEKELSNKRIFAELLIHLPLSDDGLSLAIIRKTLKENLFAHKLITNNGEYAKNFYEQKIEAIRKQIDACLLDTVDQLQLNPTIYKPIIEQFARSISAYMERIKKQESLSSNYSESSLKKLKTLFESTAKDIINHDVEILFYTAADSKLAYTFSGFNKIWINLNAPKLEELAKWFDNPIEKLTYPLIEKMVSYLTILCHEITHQKEDTGCDVTHDETFHKQLSKLLEKLFIQPGNQTDCLQLLKKVS